MLNKLKEIQAIMAKVTFFVFSVVFIMGDVSVASLSDGTMIMISVDDYYHHLGDNNVSTFKNPNPEGITYQKTITLPSTVASASSAFVQFKVTNLELTDLIFNGNTI